MSICKHALLTNQRDVGMQEYALNTLTKLGYDCSHTLTGFFKSSAMHIGLGRYTTYIQACTTHLRAFEDDHLQALLGSIFSGAVTTRARADDHQINFFH